MWEGAGKVCRSCMQVRGLCDVDLGVLNEEAGKWEYNMCVDRSPGANRAPIRNSDCFFNNHDLVPIQGRVHARSQTAKSVCFCADFLATVSNFGRWYLLTGEIKSYPRTGAGGYKTCISASAHTELGPCQLPYLLPYLLRRKESVWATSLPTMLKNSCSAVLPDIIAEK